MDELKKIVDVTIEPPVEKPPLAPTSYQVWGNALMNIGGDRASGSGKTMGPQPSDHGDGDADHDTKQLITQIPSKNSDKNIVVAPNFDGDDALKATIFCAKTRNGRSLDPNMDPKKLKRIMSNRASAQKSREKRIQYVIDKENEARTLEAHVAVLHPQVGFYRNQKQLLQMEQMSLKQKMATHAEKRIIVEAEIEENRREVNRLRQLQLVQQLQKMQHQAQIPVSENGILTEQTPYPNFIQSVPIAQFGVNAGDMNELNHFEMKPQQLHPMKPENVEMPHWEYGTGFGQICNIDRLEPQETLVSPSSNLAGAEHILSGNPIVYGPKSTQLLHMN